MNADERKLPEPVERRADAFAAGLPGRTRHVANRRPAAVDDITGRLRGDGKLRSVEEMNAAIDNELRARRDRGRY